MDADGRPLRRGPPANLANANTETVHREPSHATADARLDADAPRDDPTQAPDLEGTFLKMAMPPFLHSGQALPCGP